MREILFRAWDKVSKKYREFDGMHDTMTINEDGKVEYYNLQNGSGGDEYILEQFTGLVDRNGKRVFEGDILQWVDEDSTCEGTKLIFIVKFDGEYEGFFGEGEFDNIEPWQFRSHEIIGNIHDNHELMGVEK